MAIFHLTHSFVRRSRGSSSVATAAYNSGEKLEDNAGSTEHSDYTRKGGILFSSISLPAGTPTWANKRGELWRRLEAREDRSTHPRDALLAHNFNIALPYELTLEQNIFLAKDFVREQFTRKGYAVDWAIHAPDPRGDSRNIHLHILVPLRKITGASFGNKDRYSKGKLRQQTLLWRKSWANLVNRHLNRYGHKTSIDERSLRAQGSTRRPTRHRGPQPRVERAKLDRLRGRLPPQPIAPIMRLSKQVSDDGTVTLKAVITHTALSNIHTGLNRKANAPAPLISGANAAWPLEAIKDWAEWGHSNEIGFFGKWPQLAPVGNHVAPPSVIGPRP